MKFNNSHGIFEQESLISVNPLDFHNSQNFFGKFTPPLVL